MERSPIVSESEAEDIHQQGKLEKMPTKARGWMIIFEAYLIQSSGRENDDKII